MGKRCWHFTFTPDDSKILLACGRSNDVYVIDANTYKPITVIGGFQTPWGFLRIRDRMGAWAYRRTLFRRNEKNVLRR